MQHTIQCIIRCITHRPRCATPASQQQDSRGLRRLEAPDHVEPHPSQVRYGPLIPQALSPQRCLGALGAIDGCRTPRSIRSQNEKCCGTSGISRQTPHCTGALLHYLERERRALHACSLDRNPCPHDRSNGYSFLVGSGMIFATPSRGTAPQGSCVVPDVHAALPTCSLVVDDHHHLSDTPKRSRVLHATWQVRNP